VILNEATLKRALLYFDHIYLLAPEDPKLYLLTVQGVLTTLFGLTLKTLVAEMLKDSSDD